MYRDPATQLYVHKKQVWEEDYWGNTFRGMISDGDSLASVDSVQIDNIGQVEGSDLLGTSLTLVEGDNALAYFTAGTAGERYKIHMRVVTENGRKLERDFMVDVID